jgi:hypothetical protein
MKLQEMYVYVSKAQQVFNSGLSSSKRKDFNTKTRTATLIRWDKSGEYIFAAGKEWAKFDYEAGFEALLKRSSRWIAEASKHWPKFDYERAKAELQRRGDTHWIDQMPRGAKETIEAGEELKKSASKMAKKPFGLKEAVGANLFTPKRQRAYQIYMNGLRFIGSYSFNADKELDNLSKHDETGEFIYAAGKHWDKFDFKKGLDLLLKISIPKFIVYAGTFWKVFDFDKARNELRRRLAESKTKKDRDTIEYWLLSAKMSWPKNAQETIEAGEELRQQSKKMPKKPFGLKEAMQFRSSVEGHGRTRVVMNPSVEEINSVAMTVRQPYRDYDVGVKTTHFIFDVAKNHFYVFSPNEYHSRVMVEMGLSTLRQNTGDYPHGKLVKTNDEWKIETMRGITHENYKRIENYIRNKYLKEEHIFGLKSTWGTWEDVYEVTGPKDLKDAMGKNDDIRFLADAKSKELYVFSSNLSHTAVTDKLRINAYGYEQPIIAGRAKIVNGKWTAIDAINIWSATEALKSASTFDKFKKYLQDILNADWSFAKKYIDLHIIVKEIRDKVTEKPHLASVGLKEAKNSWEGNKDQDVAARDFWDKNLEHNELRMKNETNAGASLALRIENAGDIIRELGKSWADSGYINEKIERITKSLTYSRDWNDSLKKQIEEIPESSKLTPKVKELLRSITNRKTGKISASLNDFREAFY